MLLVQLGASGNLVVWRYAAPYWTALAATTVPLGLGEAHTLGATAHGSTIAVTGNGTAPADLPSLTDVDDRAATLAGLYVGNDGTAATWPRLDRFSVTAPASTPPPAPTPTAAPSPTATPAGPTPTPWTTGAQDAFDRSDANTLGRAESNQIWQTDGSSWGICSGRACPLGPPVSGNYARLETGLANQRAGVGRGPADQRARAGWPGRPHDRQLVG